MEKINLGMVECNVNQEQLRYDIDDVLKKNSDNLKVGLETQTYRLCDSIIEEFKYLNKRLEDKILFTVGYYDKKWRPEEEKKFDISALMSHRAFETNVYY